MSSKYYLLIVIILYSGVSHSKMYKCTGDDGSVAFQDKPCPVADGMNEVKFSDRKGSYSEALTRLISEQIKLRQYPDTLEVKTKIRPIVQASALKVYTRIEIQEHMVQECSKFIAENLRSKFEDYKEIQRDNIIVGKRVFRDGFEYPEKNVKLSRSELVNRLELGKEKNRKNYTVSDEYSKSNVETWCKNQHRLMEGAIKYGL